MKLLLLIDSLDPPGGAEQALATMAPRFVDAGLGVCVGYLKEKPGLQADLIRAGVKVHPLGGGRGRFGKVARTLHLVRAIRPDIVHTTLFESDITGRSAAALGGVPVVSSIVNTPYGPEHLGNPDLKRWRVRAGQTADIVTSTWVRRFHAVSGHVAEVMSGRLRVDRERIDVIPRGRDPEVLGRRSNERRARVRHELAVAGDDPVILAVGRHEHQKAFDVLLDAMPQVISERPDALLLVAGRKGNSTARLRAQIDRLDIGRHVSIVGARSDVADLMVASDVVVSASRREGFPNVLAEAMATETPIVSTDIGSVLSMLDDRDIAELVSPEDPIGLATAIVRQLDPSNERMSRTLRGRALFEARFTLDAVVDQMLAFYDRSLSRGQTKGSIGVTDAFHSG